MFGRLLCTLGLHHYEWRSKLMYEEDDTRVLVDQYRCLRQGCPQSHFWHTANVEARKPW